MIVPLKQYLYIYLMLALLVSAIHCGKSDSHEVLPVIPEVEYKTQNVIKVIVDGLRYTETWSDPSLF